jgi:hypothetical protein
VEIAGVVGNLDRNDEEIIYVEMGNSNGFIHEVELATPALRYVRAARALEQPDVQGCISEWIPSSGTLNFLMGFRS